MTPLRIGHVTSEISPFAKTGGLADVSAALPEALHRAGHDVRVFVPFYSATRALSRDFTPVDGLQDVSLELGGEAFPFSVHRASPPRSNLVVYFLRCPRLYDRPSIYTEDPDEPHRFLLLQRATLEACRRLGWAPDILHCHDWPTALIPLYLKTLWADRSPFRATRSILTIHNLGYQGVFPAEILPATGLAPWTELLSREDLQAGRIAFLKTGLLHADLLTTVSPTYAKEIQTEESGLGLDGILRQRPFTLVGILNGVDTRVWNPRTDPHLPFRYSARSLWRKEKNQEALLAELGLPYGRDVPVIGMITRLARQKGIELLGEPLPELLESSEVRLVVLASGSPEGERFFAGLQERFPGKVHFHCGFRDDLAHRIEAGSDLFLMPSLYEPCGLNQMYSRIYGTVPIVRRTGGLADTVEPWDPETETGSGVVFDAPSPEAVGRALRTALRLYADRRTWKKLVIRTMDCDFSWERQVGRYLEIYERLVAGSQR